MNYQGPVCVLRSMQFDQKLNISDYTNIKLKFKSEINDFLITNYQDEENSNTQYHYH